jgi:dTDP-4-amino-4,6-dideoxygalactose transaminase
MLSLPLSPKMTDQDVADVIEAVTDIAKHSKPQQLAA